MSDKQEEVTLRQLNADDLDEVLHLENLIFSTPWSKEQYRSLMQAGICKVFGAYAGDVLVAYASVSVNRAAGELEVYNIATRPEFRRRGMARRLTRKLIEAAENLGLERALLEVRAGNIPARSLYEKLGFMEAGRRKAYYTDPDEDAVLYEYSFNFNG